MSGLKNHYIPNKKRNAPVIVYLFIVIKFLFLILDYANDKHLFFLSVLIKDIKIGEYGLDAFTKGTVYMVHVFRVYLPLQAAKTFFHNLIRL